MKSKDVLSICQRMLEGGLATVNQISTWLGVARQTVWRWYMSGYERMRLGRPMKASDAQVRELCSYACNNPCASLEDMVSFCSGIGLNASRSTICRLLKKNGVTRKKGTAAYNEQRPEAVRRFVDSLVPESQSRWSALDEASFALNLCPTHGYAKKGQRAVIQRPGSRGQRLSLLLCVSASHPPKFSLLKGGVRSKEFRDFLLEVPRGQTVVLDNASIHHAKASLSSQNLPTIEETSKQQDLTLKYLPPYSPQLNPTELCFNVIRHHVRKVRPRTESSLKSAIIDKLNSLSFAGFFRHCWPNTT